MIGRTATAQWPGKTSRIARRLGWPAATVAAAAVLFLCALREARTVGTQSDGASLVLQAHAMLHGNFLLHGWYLADVSFYTTELPEYMAVELLRGMRPDVVQICAALTYTLLVLLAAFTARGAARGRAAVVRAAITVAIMLGPALPATAWLLTNPDHTGTAVPVLAVFALIDRARRRWYVPVAAGAVLALAIVGDTLVLVIGVLPVLLVFGTRACQLLLQRRMALSAAWYEASLAGAALLSVGAAAVISHFIRAFGGYVGQRTSQGFGPASAMLGNASGAFVNFLRLFSADFFGQRFGHGLVFTAIHLVAAALVVIALLLALRRFSGGGDPLPSLLAVAICANVLAYVVIFRVNGGSIREMAPVFGLGAALAGRMLAGPLLRNRLEPLLVAGLAGALWALAPPVLLAGPAARPASARLASWLESHHLRQGIAGYWQANSVTLDSAGRVTMRPVREYRTPGLKPYPWELDVPMLDSRSYDVNFLVATASGAQGGSTVTEREGIARFGKPYRVYRYEQYVIMVWHKNLLPGLARR